MASSVMGRPEEERMHQLAIRAAPEAIKKLEDHLANSKSRVVAIEQHNCDWRDGRKNTAERFLWIKARDVSELQADSSEESAAVSPSPLRFVHDNSPFLTLLFSVSPSNKSKEATVPITTTQTSNSH